MTVSPQEAGNARSLVAFDIGGTFTDVVSLGRDGKIRVEKLLSLTTEIGSEIARIVDELLEDHETLDAFIHATTVASNALLEGTHGQVALLTTRGFRDEVELRRESRPPVYDFSWERFPPIVPRRLRFEVNERVSATGEVRTPLDRHEVSRALRELDTSEIDALAICFLNAHVDPTHERTADRIAAEHLSSTPISTSHDVLPHVGEYERMSSTCVNAALVPVVASYLDRLHSHLTSRATSFHMMQSNGGLMTIADARRYPVRMIESGPAAGVLGAAALAREMRLDHVLSFDMGGTTVKGCLIENGAPLEKSEYEVGGTSHAASRYDRGAGYAVSVPSFDIVEAGAGGGSIAWAADNVVRVGPRSAGAEPGPACYGRGGSEPTVTDANVVLGYISPTTIAGDTLEIDRARALAAINQLASELQMGDIDMAYGVHTVANAAMMRTLRAVTTERGKDPREFALIAFGGSGPVHAAALAEMLGITEVYVPVAPGVFSALGLVVADVRFDAVDSIGAFLHKLERDELRERFHQLEASVLTRCSAQGIEECSVRFERYVDLRYSGQSSELTIKLDLDDEATVNFVAERFHDEHEFIFGYRRPEEPIRVSAIRVKAFAPTSRISLVSLANAYRSDTRHWKAHRRVAYFGPSGAHEVPVVPRRALIDGKIVGPAIIEEPDTTVVVPPNWSASIDELASIVLEPA